jgi:hypothetical protein
VAQNYSAGGVTDMSRTSCEADSSISNLSLVSSGSESSRRAQGRLQKSMLKFVAAKSEYTLGQGRIWSKGAGTGRQLSEWRGAGDIVRRGGGAGYLFE